jgi:uncharacterized protein DUF4832
MLPKKRVLAFDYLDERVLLSTLPGHGAHKAPVHNQAPAHVTHQVPAHVRHLPNGDPIVMPIPLTGVISNPGMGLQTFYAAGTLDPNVAAGIPSTTAYYRYYWKNLEPSPGVFNFAGIDYNLAQARAAGQTFSMRVMPFGDQTNSPLWLKAEGANGFTFSWGGTAPQTWAADPSDPVVESAYFALLQALGKRYDGQPGFGPIDIGSIGAWGEGHQWAAQPGFPLPSNAVWEQYIDQVFANFPNEIKLFGIANYTAQAPVMAYALSKGAGWRADDLGDPWHYQNLYPQILTAAGATNAWQTAPVYYEMGTDFAHLTPDQMAASVNYALATHASVIGNDGKGVPASEMPEFNYLLTHIGYRFVLNSLSYFDNVSGTLSLNFDMSNVGVAPRYGNEVLAAQLKDASGNVVLTQSTGVAVKNWLPGEYALATSTDLTGVAPGTYSFSIGVVDPVTLKPTIQLAIQGEDSFGWYPMGVVNVI